jgi:hypothetical protein
VDPDQEQRPVHQRPVQRAARQLAGQRLHRRPLAHNPLIPRSGPSVDARRAQLQPARSPSTKGAGLAGGTDRSPICALCVSCGSLPSPTVFLQLLASLPSTQVLCHRTQIPCLSHNYSLRWFHARPLRLMSASPHRPLLVGVYCRQRLGPRPPATWPPGPFSSAKQANFATS